MPGGAGGEEEEQEERAATDGNAEADGAAAAADFPCAKAVVRRRLEDAVLARWLVRTLPWGEESSLLDVLRDELTTVQELEALQHPVESSGTWAPVELLGKKTEDELVTEFQADLVRTYGSLTGSVGAAAPGAAAAAAPVEIEAEKTSLTRLP